MSKISKLIRKELTKAMVADLTHYDETKNEFIIPKFKQVKLNENEYYLLKLDDVLLREDGMEILINNWNKGSVPPFKYMKVGVDKVLGKMVLINGLGYDYVNNTDLDEMWAGWLPVTHVEVVSKL